MQVQRSKLLPMVSVVDREYRILRALAATEVPVPKIEMLGEDRHVRAAPLRLTVQPEGRVFSDYALPELPAAERRAIYFAMAEAMAKLHRVDWAAAGLADCGRPSNFYAREVAHWTRQWEMLKTDEEREAGNDASRDMDRLVRWLLSHVPGDDEEAIVHGDFHFGNLVFHHAEARVIAVLGWERATLGHPLADVARNCLPWHLPSASGGIRGLDLAEQGIPSQAEYLTHYRQCGGHAESVNAFHLAFALFRRAMEECENGNAAQVFAIARRAVELVDGSDR